MREASASVVEGWIALQRCLVLGLGFGFSAVGLIDGCEIVVDFSVGEDGGPHADGFLDLVLACEHQAVVTAAGAVLVIHGDAFEVGLLGLLWHAGQFIAIAKISVSRGGVSAGGDVALPGRDRSGEILDLGIDDAEAIERGEVLGIEIEAGVVLADGGAEMALGLIELSGGVARVNFQGRGFDFGNFRVGGLHVLGV